MKIPYVLSLEFIEYVRVNMRHSKEAIARLAERRYLFSNPKADPVDITVNDVERAIDIINNKESRYDRYANVYTWLRANASKVKDDMDNIWAMYRSYITESKLEKLWTITGVYNENCTVEAEFKEIAEAYFLA